MSLFIKQDQNRSRFQAEIAAELQEKARKRAEEADRPDGVDDSQFIQGTKKTTSLAWVWALIGVAIAVVIIVLIVKAMMK